MRELLSSENKSRLLDRLVILGTLSFLVLKFIYSSGDLTPDSLQYFLQAKDFWTYQVNFPLGYPLAIKILSYVTGSFFSLQNGSISFRTSELFSFHTGRNFISRRP